MPQFPSVLPYLVSGILARPALTAPIRNLAGTEHPDVILMDLEMPDADCWEVVRRLKNDAQTGRIPIIGMSAYAVTSEREKAIATGCDEFEAKPIEFESLVAAIRRVVANPK